VNNNSGSVVVASGHCDARWLSDVLSDGWCFSYEPCFNAHTGDMRLFRFLNCGGVDPQDEYQFNHPN
jgi:hypothetical protein